MAPGRLFGTDGIRAPFGEPPLDRPTVTALGAHLARRLGGTASAPLVLLGGDTRASTPTIAAWLAAGIAAGGGRPCWAGVVPTPAIARLAPALGAAAGVVVSASHNPWQDNGIKLLTGEGWKWSTVDETELEARLRREPLAVPEAPLPAAEEALGERYLAALRELVPGERPLAGLAVVLDCAHGAASAWAPRLFGDAGARVVTLADHPDGRNINLDCGSTAPRAMAEATLAAGAQLGIAFDGDGDRAVLADERGEVRDGDAILYLWARALAAQGELPGNRIVATSMSNLGLERALATCGVSVVRCEVGDRAVVETMRREGIVLGGEQSGHIVHLGLATTGDGLLTGLMAAALLHDRGLPLSQLLAGFVRFPQVLESVRVRAKPDLETLPAVREAAAGVRRRLGTAGRLVLRYSGTEPLVRVMIEGPDGPTIEALARELVAVLTRELGEAR